MKKWLQVLIAILPVILDVVKDIFDKEYAKDETEKIDPYIKPSTNFLDNLVLIDTNSLKPLKMYNNDNQKKDNNEQKEYTKIYRVSRVVDAILFIYVVTLSIILGRCS